MYFNLVDACTIDTALYCIYTVQMYMYTMPANFIKKHLWIACWCRHRMPFPQILQRKLLQLATKWNSPYFSLSKFPAIRTIFSGKDSLWDNREYKWYKLVEILLHQREGEGCVLVWLAEMLNYDRDITVLAWLVSPNFSLPALMNERSMDQIIAEWQAYRCRVTHCRT